MTDARAMDIARKVGGGANTLVGDEILAFARALIAEVSVPPLVAAPPGPLADPWAARAAMVEADSRWIRSELRAVRDALDGGAAESEGGEA